MTTLVPLTEDDEMRRLGIPDLVERARQKSLDVLRFPFHDGGVPKSLDATVNFLDELAVRYGRGERLVIHCAGGLGRAGTIGACLRLKLGLDATAEPQSPACGDCEARKPWRRRRRRLSSTATPSALRAA